MWFDLFVCFAFQFCCNFINEVFHFITVQPDTFLAKDFRNLVTRIFSFFLADILDPIVGGLMVSFAMISCFHILLIALIVAFRKKIIINPMTKFIAGLFIDNNKN